MPAAPRSRADVDAAPSLNLDTKLTTAVGGRTAGALKKAFGLVTVSDLLSHYPRRYARRGELSALTQLPINESVTIVADVVQSRERPMRARRGSLLEVTISDGSGMLSLTFFNQSWRSRELHVGVRGIFAGKVTDYHGSLQLTHPAYELFDEQEASLDSEAARKWAMTPIPIYPASGKLASWQIQKSVSLVLDGLGCPNDPAPDTVRRAHSLVSFGEALELIHRPQTDSDWRSARNALRFHEAFVLQAALLQQRAQSRSRETLPRVPKSGGYLERFDEALEFTLTGDQRTVGAEIAADLAEDSPMNRLLQGEVGSGKTLVALRAMLAVADSGGQSALLAPTEVLASQHLRSIVTALGPELSAELMPTLLTGQLTAVERKRALLRAVSGQARIVVGTHALLGDAVTFYDLGLIVVDEQHRFGVEQREKLRLKGAQPPHVLVLTATPIPRTVAMTVFGDLDVSTISELPSGRKIIESFVVPLAEHPAWEYRVWERSAEEIESGRQVFVVCPAISSKVTEEGADLGQPGQESAAPTSNTVASVESVSASVMADPRFSRSRIAVLHGRLSSVEKDGIMRAFAVGEIDMLISTTVIEVGVDVPNASAMIVLDADRFGVSQLHQLRGRVGRGCHAGLCLFVTRAESGSLARERVDAVQATSDGFQLAQVDLELRREGDVLGSTQSGGRSSLRILRVAHDGELIAQARSSVVEILDDDPTLENHPALSDALSRRLDEAEWDFLAKN